MRTDVAQLRALVFCRRVSDADTSATLHGVHDTRVGADFPFRCADLALYASFETLHRDRIEHEVVVRSPVSRRPRVVHFATAEEGRPRVVSFVVDLRHFEFEAAGRYTFALHASGLLVGTSTLTVAVPTTSPATLQ